VPELICRKGIMSLF